MSQDLFLNLQAFSAKFLDGHLQLYVQSELYSTCSLFQLLGHQNLKQILF